MFIGAMLDLGVDIFIRRAWYEGTDFLSPDIFRRFVLPSLKREADLAHQAGAKFGYINTSGSMLVSEDIISPPAAAAAGAVWAKATSEVAQRRESLRLSRL